MKKYRAAIIGCGNIATGYSENKNFKGIQTHIAAFRYCLSTELVGVCDINLIKAINCSARWNVKAYVKVGDLLADTKPEIVSICTPDETHSELALEVMEQSSVKGMIIEKPIALELNDIRRVIDSAKRRGITIAVNYSRRYADSHIRLQRLIKAGWIGKILHVGGLYGKGVFHTGTHWFDLARFFVGEIDCLQGFGCVDQQNDPTIDVHMDFKCGASGFLKGIDENHYKIFEMDILGTEGRLKILNSGLNYEFYRSVSTRDNQGKFLKINCSGEAGFKDFTLNLVEDMVCSIEGGTRPVCSAEDAFICFNIARLAKESVFKNMRLNV